MFYFRLKVRLPFGRARQKTRLRINREVSRLKVHEKKLQLNATEIYATKCVVAAEEAAEKVPRSKAEVHR